MAKCKIFATIENGAEEPIEGVLVQFIPAALPAVNSVSGKGIHPDVLTALTTSTGYFEKELVQDTDFIVIIQSMGLKEKIRVPAETEKNLFELTGAYTVGDKTVHDTGESEW